MSKAVKTVAGLTGGGAIVGGGIAVDKYLLNKESEEESTVSFLPSTSTSGTVQVVNEETVRYALSRQGLTVASNDSDYQTIHQDIKDGGTFSWFDSISSEYGIKKPNSNYSDMKDKCQQELKKKYSDFKDRLRSPEFKAIKLFCTKDYTLIENAKDYLQEGAFIGDSDENSKLEESEWTSQLQKFKSKAGNDKKGFEDMKNRCLEIGKILYRKIKDNDENRSEFYEYCVIDNTE